MMVDDPYLAQLLTGFLFLVVAIALLRLASRTGQLAERLLGSAFLLMGISYVISEVSYAFDLETLLEPLAFVSRLVYAVSVMLVALLTRRTLQSDEVWGRWLMYGCAALVALGIGLSVPAGDIGGFLPLRNGAFWLEWTGLLLPFVWMGVAAFVQYGKSRQRVRLGLCEPLRCNRLLLFSLFALIEVFGFFIWAALYIIFESQKLWTPSMDVLYAVTDDLAILTMWLAFFPPARYRSWIESQAASEAAGRV
jgi:hypothetical protein